MRTEEVDRVSLDLLDELGVTASGHVLEELERHHIVEHRRGARITYVVARSTSGVALGLLPVYQFSRTYEASLVAASLVDELSLSAGSRVCSAGGAGGYRNHLALSAAIDPACATAAAGALVSAAREIASGAGCPQVLIPDLDPAQAGWLAEFEPEAVADTTRDKAVMPIEWGHFSEYLAALPRKRRWQVRRERHAFATSGIVMRDEPLSSVAAEVAPLLAQTQQRHGDSADPVEAEFYLAMLALTPGSEVRALVGYLSGRPVAFSVVHRRGDTWAVRAVGRDYAAPEHSQYFNLTYYEPIERAITDGAALIDFGVGSLSAKRFRGCRLEPLRSLLLPVAPSRDR
ncbi:GNAT family N-acetyltransferase [Streptomyces sp. SID8379]|uniref:GNAT family N-acetyltransferase n=1 Tax=unclassified Streptomyces TaxID=2593676 RepID=UPI00037BF133|nr:MULTISPECIES: GNAT family N-acetyltransferase [unclassified Streptomyces]MYW69879.1 GNAT family N-acetyltransferase [Streptomyces sp. SID8379]